LARLKKTLMQYKTLDVARTGLEFWISVEDASTADVPVIAVLCTKHKHLSDVLNISKEARVAIHLAESSEEGHPGKYFVPLEYVMRRAILPAVLHRREDYGAGNKNQI